MEGVTGLSPRAPGSRTIRMCSLDGRSKGTAPSPRRKSSTYIGKKRERRSLRSVARTERLNRFAPRAKSIAADYYLFDCLSNFVCGEAFVDGRRAQLRAPKPPQPDVS